MTGNEKKMRNKTNNRAGRILFGAMAAGILLGSAIAVAEDNRPVVTHIFDTSTDRVPLVTAFPKYPSVARRDRIEGEATVCFKIKTNGKISRPSMRDSTHRIFRRPTMRAIKKSTFEPLGPSQILATAKTCRTYRFRLEPVVVDTESVQPPRY
jgi:TonB family protein